MLEISQILAGFRPISLEEIGKVKLMDRRDTKFVLRSDQLPAVLNELRKEYRVLEINGVRNPRYETIYYDTSDFRHFHLHHTKHLNRYKVRIRKYLESDESFFEIKFRNNHGRTLKSRIQLENPEEGITETVRKFASRKAGIDGARLEPKMRILFSRITLVNERQTERVTIDTGLHYFNGHNGHAFEPLVVAEVKQDCRDCSTFTSLMKRQKIREFSISKYCLGIMTLHSHVRHNRFKPKLRHLNKLLYGPSRNV